MNLRETGCPVVDWIRWAEDRNHWQVLVNTVMNLWGYTEGGVCLD